MTLTIAVLIAAIVLLVAVVAFVAFYLPLTNTNEDESDADVIDKK